MSANAVSWPFVRYRMVLRKLRISCCSLCCSSPVSKGGTTQLFLDKTNMLETPFSRWIASSTLAPCVRRDAMGEQEYLHHGPGREHLHDGAAGRLDLRGGFAHLDPGDPLDFLPQRFRGVGEQLAVKILHPSGARGAAGQRLLRRRQGP